MKRDLDLVRKLLIHFDEKEDAEIVEHIHIEGYDTLTVNYHLVLMDEAGFLSCERDMSSTTPDRVIRVQPFFLTWKGHEFLDSIRNEDIWNKTKDLVFTKTGTLTFEIIKQALNKVALSTLGL